MSSTASIKDTTNPVNELKSAVDANLFNDDPQDIALFSEDIWSQGDAASCILSPRTVDEVCAVVSAAYAAGVALNPRGAGMSYTRGYTPDRPGVGILDLSKLNGIVDINTEDMYVTVEAGCTWATLHEALIAKGVRTPFWGPLSGLVSTIGGGLSQNNAFFGAGVHGTTSDSVLSVAVVLADGTLVRTGSAGAPNAKPFFRHYGPDLTGLFCGDAGAFGHKVEVTLRLIPVPEFEECASFEFSSLEATGDAMASIMRENIACEVFGFDPNLQRVRMKRASLTADATALANVVKKQGSILAGLKEGAKVALAGRTFLDKAAYGLHFVVEGRSAAGVRAEMARLKDIAARYKGTEIENSIPKIVRANPFNPLNNILGPNGERWVPVHGIVPASEGTATFTEINKLFEQIRGILNGHDILTGFLLTNIGTTGFLIEPVFIWPEALTDIHKQTVEPDYLAKLSVHEPNSKATTTVAQLRQGVIDIFQKRGGAHFQIGRTYPYAESRAPETLELIQGVKRLVDADGLVNPGALGLGPVAER